MEKQQKLIALARRDDSKRTYTGTLIRFGVCLVVFCVNLPFFLTTGATWSLVILILSSILTGLTLVGLLFTIYNRAYAKKVSKTALIYFNEEDETFVVHDFVFGREAIIKKEDAIEIRMGEKGDTYLWYLKNGKRTAMSIGYGEFGTEKETNEKITSYKSK